MAEVTPSKQVDERFQNRLAQYKKQHVERSIKLQGAFEASVKQDQNLTSCLQQKVLQQNKDKRSVKKKLDNSSNSVGLSYFQKRREDENEPPTKVNKQHEEIASKSSTVPNYSSDVVYGLEHNSANSNLQISSNVTMKPLRSFKSEVKDEKPLIESVPSVGPLHTMNSSPAPNTVVNFKQEQRDYFPETDLQPSMNFEFNELTQDAFASLLSDFLSEENKDSLFNQNHQISPQQPIQQQHRTPQMVEQQLSSIERLHSQPQQNHMHGSGIRQPNPTAPFHQVQVKIEDTHENNLMKIHSISNQQQLPLHQQQQRPLHQMPRVQLMQHQNTANQRMQMFKEQQQSHPRQRSFQQHLHLPSSTQSTRVSPLARSPQTQQLAQQPQNVPVQFQQQQQMRLQSAMSQRPKSMPMQRPQPAEYNINVAPSTNTQFTNIQCNLPSRLAQHNHQITNFSNGATLRTPNVNPINRPFSTELMMMSQQRANCQQSNMHGNGMNINWTNNMITSRTRHPQSATYNTNYIQNQGVTLRNGSNMNMMPNQMHQTPSRSTSVPEPQKSTTLNMQHPNYRQGQINNLPMIQCMKSNIPSPTNPGYNPMPMNAALQTPNVLPNHMDRGVVSINQNFQNNHRNSGLANGPINTASNMGNCNNNNNDVNQVSDLSFLDRQWNEEELMTFLQ